MSLFKFLICVCLRRILPLLLSPNPYLPPLHLTSSSHLFTPPLHPISLPVRLQLNCYMVGLGAGLYSRFRIFNEQYGGSTYYINHTDTHTHARIRFAVIHYTQTINQRVHALLHAHRHTVAITCEVQTAGSVHDHAANVAAWAPTSAVHHAASYTYLIREFLFL